MLKEYANAPVQEVSMGVYFEPIPMLNIVNLVGRCFNLLEAYGDYSLEETQYIGSRLETENRRVPTHQFKISDGIPEIGCKLVSSDRTVSIFIQNNRFSVNWARQANGEYPRYDKLRPAFFEKLNKFTSEFNGQPKLSPVYTQCGIRYDNQVPDNDLLGNTKFNFLNLEHFSNHEGVNFSASQRLENNDEVGRLYMEAQTIFSFGDDGAGKIKENRLLRMSLTFRGKPAVKGIDGISPFLDRGHEAIVTTFSQSLSEEGRKLFKEKSRA